MLATMLPLTVFAQTEPQEPADTDTVAAIAAQLQDPANLPNQRFGVGARNLARLIMQGKIAQEQRMIFKSHTINESVL